MVSSVHSLTYPIVYNMSKCSLRLGSQYGAVPRRAVPRQVLREQINGVYPHRIAASRPTAKIEMESILIALPRHVLPRR